MTQIVRLSCKNGRGFRSYSNENFTLLYISQESDHFEFSKILSFIIFQFVYPVYSESLREVFQLR